MLRDGLAAQRRATVCFAPAIRQLKFSSTTARGQDESSRRRHAASRPAQLGSAGVVADVDFVRRVVEMTIRRFIPIALRAAASIHPLAEHKVAMGKSRGTV